jgi:hypothetical protein
MERSLAHILVVGAGIWFILFIPCNLHMKRRFLSFGHDAPGEAGGSD